MKNKVSMLVILGVSMLTGCATKKTISEQNSNIQKPEPPKDLAGRLEKFPKDTVFASDTAGFNLKNENGKWKYIVKDKANKTFTFDVKEMKENGIFDETEAKKMTFDGQKMDTKLKIVRNNELSYAHYGFLESLKPENGKMVNVYNSFIMAQDDKEVVFQAPEKATTYSGSTTAMLTKRKNGEFSYKTLNGIATMTVNSGTTIADVEMAYKDFKTLTVKNLDLSNGAVGDWAINDSDMGFFKIKNNETNQYEHDSYLSVTILDNKEIVGSYRAELYEKPITSTNKVSYRLDGVFGMKKQ